MDFRSIVAKFRKYSLDVKVPFSDGLMPVQCAIGSIAFALTELLPHW